MQCRKQLARSPHKSRVFLVGFLKWLSSHIQSLYSATFHGRIVLAQVLHVPITTPNALHSQQAPRSTLPSERRSSTATANHEKPQRTERHVHAPPTPPPPLAQGPREPSCRYEHLGGFFGERKLNGNCCETLQIVAVFYKPRLRVQSDSGLHLSMCL